ncbi:MAG: C1 family peptidase [Muribaculaceae bacterium]|nr:C1 family peptidase [Muribaculaceae bacterium]MDE6643108.1 C1 family peptidase [Muribaculaceae bacterium]
MKHLLAGALAIATLVNVSAQTKTAPDTIKGFAFTDVKVFPTTSVKNQNKSGTCWCFAGTSFFEDEIIRKGGKPLDLSEMFTVRQCYIDKADKYIRTGGNINFAQGGSALDVPYVWERYGAVPEEVYQGLNYGEDKHAHYEMAAALKAYLDAVLKNPNRRLSTAWKQGFESILDAYLGKVPETFVVDGKTYTPKTYAESLKLNVPDYISVTSFTHHPFYTQFPVEVADNWLWGSSYNVPMEEMKAMVDNAIDKGYTVVWAADVSEPGFKYNDGYALIPKVKTEEDMTGSELARWVKMSKTERQKLQNEINGPTEEIVVTQESRQEMFDRQETTDDHGMVIVGRAVDQNGNKYYKVKNSWDTNQVYGGYFYVSEPYFLAKTLDILVHRDAIPAAIAKKMKI